MTGTLPPASPEARVSCYGCGSRYDALNAAETSYHTAHGGNARGAYVRPRRWRQRSHTVEQALNPYEARLLASLTACQQERDAAIRAAHALADELARRDSRLTRLIARR